MTDQARWNRIHLAMGSVVALALGFACAADATASQGPWETTLQGRDIDLDGEVDAFYDTVLNVTWLRNADLLGRPTWHEATDAARAYQIAGVSGWRLPALIDTGTPGCSYGREGTDCGYNVQTIGTDGTVYSELAHLYFVTLGNKSIYGTNGEAQADAGLTNTGGFQGLSGFGAWTATETGLGASEAFYFYTADGAQLVTGEQSQVQAMLVRTGDVSPVPEPQTWAGMLAGLMALWSVLGRGQRFGRR